MNNEILNKMSKLEHTRLKFKKSANDAGVLTFHPI